jgi:hypothetical protein
MLDLTKGLIVVQISAVISKLREIANVTIMDFKISARLFAKIQTVQYSK